MPLVFWSFRIMVGIGLLLMLVLPLLGVRPALQLVGLQQLVPRGAAGGQRRTMVEYKCPVPAGQQAPVVYTVPSIGFSGPARIGAAASAAFTLIPSVLFAFAGIWRPGHPASVVGLDSYVEIFADSRKWLQHGWLDYIAPQLFRVSSTALSLGTTAEYRPKDWLALQGTLALGAVRPWMLRLPLPSTTALLRRP